MSKHYLKICTFFIFFVVSFNAFSEDTHIRTIDRISINGRAPVTEGANYYLLSSLGWGAPSCPGALYAYINEKATGAKAMLSVALAAKTSQTPVKLSGTCVNASNFIIDYMTLEPQM